MKSKVFITFFSLTVLTTGLTIFYYYATHDGNYEWSKEFNEDVRDITEKHNFKIATVEEINPNRIKLPIKRSIQLKLQKLGSKIGLTIYGHEFGQSISVRSNDKGKLITFKAWCLSDHIKGLEIEYMNLDNVILDSLRNDARRHFDNYDIVWTKVSEN